MNRSDMQAAGSSFLLESYHNTSGATGAATYTEVIHEEPSSSSSSSSTVTSTSGSIRLRLTKNPPRSARRVSWTADTVDNELMNKKKSKCCCVFQKAKNWGESSSEDENDDKDCAHCKGHKKKDFNSQRVSDKQESELINEDDYSEPNHYHDNHHSHNHPNEHGQHHGQQRL